ncbi:hypothetical protein GCM10023100_08340 [Actinocorallia cavernae]|uniref:Uncharacterized protein n=2 Tax=Actinomycetes TaxID=1760 RepID=A0ABN3LQE3_9ACTN
MFGFRAETGHPHGRIAFPRRGVGWFRGSGGRVGGAGESARARLLLAHARASHRLTRASHRWARAPNYRAGQTGSISSAPWARQTPSGAQATTYQGAG